MPSYNWPVDPIELIQQFEALHKNGEAGALFITAVSSVDSLYYLDDIDRDFDNSRKPLADHNPAVIDVAHARWAVSTAITALDLCAAGLGRAFCGNTGKHEFGLEKFNPNRAKQKSNNRNHLSPDALNWVDDVFTDPKYSTVKFARDWLTHKRLIRHFHLLVGGPPQRLELTINSARLPVRQLIETARDFASHHVLSFVQLLPHL